MRKSLLSGCLLAVAAAVTVLLGQVFGDDLQHVALLGVALGGVVGLVPHRSGWGRLGGFATGFVLAWAGFALRAAVLPDTAGGRAVAAFLVVLACAGACAVSAGRIPLWSALVGVAALVGAYEQTYTDAPSQLLTQSTSAATTVLLAAALGYLAASLLTAPVAGVEGPGVLAEPAPATDDQHDSIDTVLAGDTK